MRGAVPGRRGWTLWYLGYLQVVMRVRRSLRNALAAMGVVVLWKVLLLEVLLRALANSGLS